MFGLEALLKFFDTAIPSRTERPAWRQAGTRSKGRGWHRQSKNYWRNNVSNYETKQFGDIEKRNALYQEKKLAGTPGLVKYSDSSIKGNLWFVAWPRS